MMQLVTDHSLSVTCDNKNFNPTIAKIRVRNVGPLVAMVFENKQIEVRTPTAHQIGFAIIRAADDCIKANELGAKEFVVLTINHADIHLPASSARKLGAALVRRSDPADDFQRKYNLRTSL